MNQSHINSDEKQYFIPMFITPELATSWGLDKSQMTWMPVGKNRHLVLKVPATKEQYETYMRATWREEKREHRKALYEESAEAQQEAIGNESEDEDADVEAFVEKEELLLELRRLIAELDELDRIIVEKYYFGRESEDAIARATGVSQKTVNKHKHKVLGWLREQLKEFM